VEAANVAFPCLWAPVEEKEEEEKDE